jgi:hypothetical protein
MAWQKKEVGNWAKHGMPHAKDAVGAKIRPNRLLAKDTNEHELAPG